MSGPAGLVMAMGRGEALDLDEVIALILNDWHTLTAVA